MPSVKQIINKFLWKKLPSKPPVKICVGACSLVAKDVVNTLTGPIRTMPMVLKNVPRGPKLMKQRRIS